MEKNTLNIKGVLTRPKARLTLRKRKTFLLGFSEGLEMPLSLSIPEIRKLTATKQRTKLKSRLGNYKTDMTKLNADLRRAMLNVIRTS